MFSDIEKKKQKKELKRKQGKFFVSSMASWINQPTNNRKNSWCNIFTYNSGIYYIHILWFLIYTLKPGILNNIFLLPFPWRISLCIKFLDHTKFSLHTQNFLHCVLVFRICRRKIFFVEILDNIFISSFQNCNQHLPQYVFLFGLRMRMFKGHDQLSFFSLTWGLQLHLFQFTTIIFMLDISLYSFSCH